MARTRLRRRSKKPKSVRSKATYQDVSGTSRESDADGKDGTPMPNYRQLDVVLRDEGWPETYMRCSGPAKTIEKHKKSFEEWLKNFK